MTVEGIVAVQDLARKFGRVPPQLRNHLRPKLREAGEKIRGSMRRKAGWSSRIPAAIGMTVSFAKRGGGIKFRVDARRAPHARPYEGVTSRSGSFRHPVMGDRDVWVSQATRPFFFPSIQENRGEVKNNISAAVKASLREVSR